MNSSELKMLLDYCVALDPLVSLLSKITLLLMIAWCTHWLLLRANPRWRVLLWRSIAIGLLLVPLLHVLMPPVAISRPAIGDSVDSESTLAVRNSETLLVTSAVSTTPAETATGTHAHVPHFPMSATNPSISTRTLLIGLWCVGFSFCLIRIAGGMWYVRRLVAQSVDVPEPVSQEFQRSCNSILGHQSVAVGVSSQVSAPILTGVISPTVLIPSCLIDESRRTHLAAVFAHELAHVESRDLFWNTVVHFVASALWFHPLAWFTRAAHAASCEAVSDAKAVDHIGDVQDYGRTLAQVALDAATPPILSLAMAKRSGIRRRVVALERHVFSRDLSWRIASGAMVCSLIFAAVVGGFKIVLADESKTTQAKPAAGESTSVKLSLEEEAVEKALKFLVKRQNANGSFGGKTASHTPAITGLVGMAMLESGSKPGVGPYGSELQKAVNFILSSVREDGVIGTEKSGLLYSHAYALRFLAEAQIVSKSKRIEEAITKASKALVDCQNDLDGWRYTINSKDADSSATACVLIALAKARQAGVEVPQETFDRAIKYLKSCQSEEGSFNYVAAAPGGMGRSTPRTAAVLSALCLSDVKDAQTESGFDYVTKNLDPSNMDQAHYFYGQFHLATAMRFASDQQFESWHGPVTEQLLKTELPDGSWSREHYETEYITAQACIVLLSRHGKK